LIDLGDPKGFYAMGMVYHKGLEVDMNMKTALDYFKQGAQIDLGDPDVYNAMGVYYQYGFGGLSQDPKTAVQWYEKAMKKGSLKAAYNLGRMHPNGDGIKKDANKAFVLIQRAAAQGRGYPEAVYKWGYLYENGIGIAKDKEMAKDLYQEAEELGYVEEQAAANPTQTGTADTDR
jgi:uncharacterized protein